MIDIMLTVIGCSGIAIFIGSTDVLLRRICLVVITIVAIIVVLFRWN